MKIKQQRLNCKRCDHKWTPRGKEVRQCPKCKTAYWDKKDEVSSGEKTSV